ncbi:hypothetical protein HDU79_007166 [Rhizoclosmatium sp. JEL0117]|nr:hypothetical protein HDU79_007166 [Rhizoclosmatium sp. JEL0117]
MSDAEMEEASAEERMQVDVNDDSSEDEDDDDDDPVVQEIPVLLSAQLLARHGLVLAQHPSTRRANPLEAAAAVRVKPVAQRFEVDVALEKGDTFSEDTAEKLGRGVDNEEIATAYDKRNPYREEQRKLLEKVTLQSSLLPDSTGGQYLIGALRDDEFHLTPISAIIQLRPALRYLDKIQEKEKVAQQKITQHELNLEQPNRKEEDPQEKGVNLSVRTVEDNPEALKKAREIDEEKRFAQEEWVELALYADNTPEAAETYDKLFSLGDELTYSFSKQDYLENIGPKLSSSVKHEIDQGAGSAKKNVKPNWSMDDIRNLPLPSLLKSLMLHAHVVSFTQIQSLTENQFDDQDILEHLERIAVLVRGVWVVRSELLYTGRAADARRLLLQTFNRTSKPVSRYDINRLAKLPHTVITNMFIEICARIPVLREANNGHHVGGGKVVPGADVLSKWGLKVERDEEFCERWPDVVEKQEAIVESEGERARHALEHRTASKIGAPKEHHIPTSIGAPTRTSATPTAAAPAAPSAPASKPAAASSSKAAPATRAASASADIFKVTGTSAESQCENLLYFALNKHGVCSPDYLLATIERHKPLRGSDGAENLLDSDDVTPAFVLAVIAKLCVLVQGRYVLKSLGGSVDEFRNPVVTLFKQKSNVKKGEVLAACQTATGKNLAQSMYAKIMKELATSTGTAWEFKTGPSV